MRLPSASFLFPPNSEFTGDLTRLSGVHDHPSTAESFGRLLADMPRSGAAPVCEKVRRLAGEIGLVGIVWFCGGRRRRAV